MTAHAGHPGRLPSPSLPRRLHLHRHLHRRLHRPRQKVFRPSDLDMLVRIVYTLELLLLFAVVVGACIGLLVTAVVHRALSGF